MTYNSSFRISHSIKHTNSFVLSSIHPLDKHLIFLVKLHHSIVKVTKNVITLLYCKAIIQNLTIESKKENLFLQAHLKNSCSTSYISTYL